jgi:hypothetical protein
VPEFEVLVIVITWLSGNLDLLIALVLKAAEFSIFNLFTVQGSLRGHDALAADHFCPADGVHDVSCLNATDHLRSVGLGRHFSYASGEVILMG